VEGTNLFTFLQFWMLKITDICAFWSMGHQWPF